jgi:predicted lipoprotein with Yx(FWY)xxD motif
MLESARAQETKSRRSRRAGRRVPRRASIAGALAVCLAVASLAAVALATTTALSLGSASNSTLGKQIVTNAQGRTLYSLSGESTRHLLCKSKECFKHWPPVTVPSSNTKLKAGAGVQGHLAILHRAGGMLQVTLRGRPLYRYSQDHAKGDAEGEGVESFGGTWHAVAASSSAPSGNPTPSTPVMPSAPVPYGY